MSTVFVVGCQIALGCALGVPAPAAHGATNVLPSSEPRLDDAPAARVIPRWRAQAAAAQRFANTRDGRVGWAVLDHRGLPVAGWRMHETFQSASVFKAMLAVCFLNDPRVRDRALSATERSRLRAMITRSDDDDANTTYGLVRQSCLYRLARNVGMRRFHTEGHWGRTRITPYGTANLFFRLDRRIAPRHRADAMRWFRSVVPSQRWGLARVVPSGMAIAFKGGFAYSFGGGHTISQGALLSAPNGDRIAIAVLTNHSPTAAYGHATIEGIGARLLRSYRPLPAVPAFLPMPPS
ncbi:MAG: hypothetical protein JWL76_2159 [Thermoleophilia bacterium]|nr:hypothetical protein [Thermoleophilia bacterium]